MVDQVAELASLAGALGAPLVSSERMPWGDAGATWRLDLEDGRRVVARRFADRDGVRADRIAGSISAATATGIPVPAVAPVATADADWLVSDFVPGTVGAAWLGDAERARRLAVSMGDLRRRLLGIDQVEAITTLAPRQADRRPDALDERVVAALEDARDVLARRRVRPAFVHGDFAPINVILDDAGQIRALLDFEHAHAGDPLEDAAWWGWVVRHHHPAAWEAAWPTFCSAAGVDPVQDERILRAFMLRELERRAAVARAPVVRHRWLARLAEAAMW